MREITKEERQHYDRHGVVHLPGLLDDDWLKRLEAAFAEEVSADQTRVNFVDFKALMPMIEASGAEFVTRGLHPQRDGSASAVSTGAAFPRWPPFAAVSRCRK